MNDESLAWVSTALARAGIVMRGSFEVVKRRPWAVVLCAPSSEGDVYFKANAPGGRHEAAVVRALADAWPDRVPAPLATDEDRGWLLSRDHGRRLDETLAGADPLPTWEGLLPRYAELQLASAHEPERWLALGVPDRRIGRLPTLAAELLRSSPDLSERERAQLLSLLPELEAHCDILASLPCAAALEHGDLHAANILVDGDQHWLFDWADSSVSHPFATLLVTCHMLIDRFETLEGRKRGERLRDAYLEPWTTLAPPATLRAVFPVALWVAHLGRALDWQHMLADADGPGRAEWQRHIAAWLRRWLGRRAWVGGAPWP